MLKNSASCGRALLILRPIYLSQWLLAWIFVHTTRYHVYVACSLQKWEELRNEMSAFDDRRKCTTLFG